MIIEKFEKVNNFLMKNILIIFIILILVYIFTGFGNNRVQPINQETAQYDYVASPRIAKMSADAAPMMLASRNSVALGSSNSSEKIVQNFTLSIESSNVDKAKTAVENEIKNVIQR